MVWLTVYDFLADHSSIEKKDVLTIHEYLINIREYLIKKGNIKQYQTY